MKVNIFAKDTKDGKKFAEMLKEIDSASVRIGYQSGEKFYTPTDEDGNKIKNAKPVDMLDVVMFNELGTSRIPPRPFLTNSVDLNRKRIETFIDENAKEVVEGKITSEQFLNRIGTNHVSLVQESILTGDYVPNAPYTIMKKHSDKPLIDTGQMMQSVHYIIKEGGGT